MPQPHLSPTQMAIVVAINLAMTVVIYLDSTSRRYSRGLVVLWSALAFLFGWIGWTGYLIFRYFVAPKNAAPTLTSTCRYCGGAIVGSPAYCPHCSSQLKGSAEIHSS